MIAILLELYHSETGREVVFRSVEDWLDASLLLHHADFSFLRFEIKCRYSRELGAAYCRDAGHEWFALPGEWFEVLLK